MLMYKVLPSTIKVNHLVFRPPSSHQVLWSLEASKEMANPLHELLAQAYPSHPVSTSLYLTKSNNVASTW